MKSFCPGGADEKVHLINAILNPNVCSQPRSAQVELFKWKENLRRCAELGCHPPDLLLAYRAMESIFSAVSDKAEAQLHHRWVSLRNELGLPHLITLNAIQKGWRVRRCRTRSVGSTWRLGTQHRTSTDRQSVIQTAANAKK